MRRVVIVNSAVGHLFRLFSSGGSGSETPFQTPRCQFGPILEQRAGRRAARKFNSVDVLDVQAGGLPERSKLENINSDRNPNQHLPPFHIEHGLYLPLNK